MATGIYDFRRAYIYRRYALDLALDSQQSPVFQQRSVYPQAFKFISR